MKGNNQNVHLIKVLIYMKFCKKLNKRANANVKMMMIPKVGDDNNDGRKSIS